MSDDPGIDPYATQMSADLEPQKEPLDPRAEGHPSRNVPRTFLGLTLAFLDSPRIAMRAVLDTAPAWTVLPLAAVWGMVQTTARAGPLIVSEPTPRELPGSGTTGMSARWQFARRFVRVRPCH